MAAELMCMVAFGYDTDYTEHKCFDFVGEHKYLAQCIDENFEWVFKNWEKIEEHSRKPREQMCHESSFLRRMTFPEECSQWNVPGDICKLEEYVWLTIWMGLVVGILIAVSYLFISMRIKGLQTNRED